jgi:hypothetical protein
MNEVPIDYYEQERQGSEAQQVLESPLIQEWFKQIDQHLLLTLKATSVSDSASREKIHSLMWATDRLRQHIEVTIQSGVMATEHLKLIRKPLKQKVMDWIQV